MWPFSRTPRESPETGCSTGLCPLRPPRLPPYLFQKKKKLEDLPPTPEIYKPKSPVSSIKVKRKRGSRLQGGGRVSYRESPL